MTSPFITAFIHLRYFFRKYDLDTDAMTITIELPKGCNTHYAMAMLRHETYPEMMFAPWENEHTEGQIAGIKFKFKDAPRVHPRCLCPDCKGK